MARISHLCLRSSWHRRCNSKSSVQNQIWICWQNHQCLLGMRSLSNSLLVKQPISWAYSYWYQIYRGLSVHVRKRMAALGVLYRSAMTDEFSPSRSNPDANKLLIQDVFRCQEPRAGATRPWKKLDNTFKNVEEIFFSVFAAQKTPFHFLLCSFMTSQRVEANNGNEILN